MATVNLTTNDYASQLAAIARRQKYAELLAQQGAEDIDVQSVGGIPTPISPFQGLAKVLKSGMGAYLGRKAGEDEAALDTIQNQKLSDVLSRYYDERPDMSNKNDVAVTGALDLTTGKRGPDVGTIGTSGVFNRPTTGQEQMQAARGLVGTKYAGMVPEMLSNAQAEIKADRDRDQPKMVAAGANGMIDSNPRSPTYGQRFAVPAVKPSNKTPFAAVVNGKPGMFVYDDAGNLVAVPGMTPFRTGGGDGGEKPPSGYRSDGRGGLAFIPGGPADPGNKAKPPSQAFLRLEGDDLKDVQLAGSIASDLDSYAKKIDTGKMTLGLAANLGSRAGLTLGMANQNAREIGSFRATLAKLRNDTLRLNKGTQTEGDAVRAFDELFQNINDQGFVRKRLDEINQINRRAQAQRITAINDRRELSGYDPIDESKYLIQPSAYESPAAQNTGGAGGVTPAAAAAELARRNAAKGK